MKIKYELFRPATDLHRQRNLFRECFPETVGTSIETEKHYHWKFKKGHEYVASYDELGLIGYYAALPYSYRIRENKFDAAMVCDVMTSIKARGQGVFTQLGKFSTTQFKNSGFAFATGFPIRAEVIPGHLKVGWKKLFRLPIYLSILNFDFIKFGPLRFILNTGWATIGALISLFARKSDSQYAVETINQRQFLEDTHYESFLSNWQKENTITLIKDKPFIEWRTSAPETEYFFTLLKNRETKKIVALAISRSTVLNNISCLAVLDLMCTHQNIDQIKTVFRELKSISKKQKNSLVICMSSSWIAKKYLFLRNGFFRSHKSFVFILKKLNYSHHDATLTNQKDWHLMWIDSDDL